MRVFLGDKNSAVRIIEELFTQPPFLMLAQEEMLVAPHAIEDTTAAKLVMPEGYLEMKRIKKEKEELERKVEESKRFQETPALRQEIDELKKNDRRLEEKVDDLTRSIKSIAERGPRDGWFEERIRVALKIFLGEFPARKIVAWFSGGVYLAERPIYA